MKKIWLLFVVLLGWNTLFSQTNTDWTTYFEQLREDIEDEKVLEILFDDLSYLAAHPLDINTATKEELKPLLFLSDAQIEELLNYRRRYGKMSSLFELKTLRTFDFQTIQWLLPFVYIGKEERFVRAPSPRNLWKYGKSELFVRYDQNLNQKKGYRSVSDSVLTESPNKKYLGEPFYHSLRYSYSFDNRLQAGFVGEKDAGEPFFKQGSTGYDYYSAHAFYKGKRFVRSVALGDFKASFGQGLLMSMDFAPGRYALVAQGERRSNGFRRHYSTNEVDFLRGGAFSVHWGKWDAYAFYSYRKLDARTDSLDVLSFKRDGLHRLQREMDKKRKVPMHTTGLNLRFTSPSVRVGLTGIYYTVGDYSIMPDDKPYNRFAFRGSTNWGVSVDYLLRKKRVKFYGETAVSKNGAIATINALQVSPSSAINASLLYRNYAKDYHVFYGRSFAQRSSMQGEEGVYVGLQIQPFAYWKINAYADLFRFSWLNHNVNAPSWGKEYLCQVDYGGLKPLATTLQYRFRQKETNYTDNDQLRIQPYKQHRIRLQGSYSICTHLNMRTSVDGNLYIDTDGEKKKGWMLSQNLGWKKRNSPLQVDGYLAWFHTDDYSTKVYSYEKSLLYTYNSSSFYGKGIRLALNVRWYMTSHLTVSAKAAWVRYVDRDRIGRDLEEIEGKSKTDLYMNLRWTF